MNLLQAINQGNVDKVNELLSNQSTNVNITDNHNFSGTSLNFNSFSQKITRNFYFLLALHHAVIKKNVEMCVMLLNNKKFDPLIKSFEGCTALMIAIIANVQIEIIEILVKKNPKLVIEKNNKEVPPLHEAIKNRRLDIVKLLVSNGANVNCFDLDLENALHLAASNTDYDIIQYLLNDTEVDPRAKNRDEMNPLCLLLVRSRNEDQELVSRCFFLMLEKSYDKNTLTNTYSIHDIFQCAFLACVYSHTEIVKYLVHNVYSVNNSKYQFVRRLSEICCGDNTEFLYYILVFLHDDIDRYDKFNFPRFFEINYYLCVRSVVTIIDLLLSVDDANELITATLENMKSIGFNIRVKEFEDQIGNLFFIKYSYNQMQDVDIDRIDRLLQYFLAKGFKLNLIVRGFLHSIAIARDSSTINIVSTTNLLRVLIHYSTTFFADLENWKQIRDFKNFNPHIRQIVEWLLTMGNSSVSTFIDINCIFSLKNLCRNRIRDQLKNDPAVLCNSQKLLELGLPAELLNYIVFKV